MVEIKVKVGDSVPDVPLEAYPNSRKVKLSDYKGKWLILYFYPKDDTPGCTKEACTFRDSMTPIKGLEAEVVGVSTDSVNSHQKFHSKHDLNFTLLSDPKGELGSLMGALREGFGPLRSMRRITFLINPNSHIVKIYPKVDPAEHADEIQRDLKALKSG